MFTRNPNRAKAQDDLQPNVEAIAEFLTQCVRLGCDVGPTLVQLTAIDPEDPDAAPRTHTFDEASEAAKWAAEKNGAYDVYILAGEPGKNMWRRVRKKGRCPAAASVRRSRSASKPAARPGNIEGLARRSRAED